MQVVQVVVVVVVARLSIRRAWLSSRACHTACMRCSVVGIMGQGISIGEQWVRNGTEMVWDFIYVFFLPVLEQRRHAVEILVELAAAQDDRLKDLQPCMQSGWQAPGVAMDSVSVNRPYGVYCGLKISCEIDGHERKPSSKGRSRITTVVRRLFYGLMV